MARDVLGSDDLLAAGGAAGSTAAAEWPPPATVGLGLHTPLPRPGHAIGPRRRASPTALHRAVTDRAEPNQNGQTTRSMPHTKAVNCPPRLITTTF